MVIIAGIAVILIITAIVFYLLRSRAAGNAGSGATPKRVPAIPHRRNLDYHPRAKPVSPLRPPMPSAGLQPATLPPPKSMSVVEGRTDIADSMRALVIKYTLGGFTLATDDGLVFASGGEVDAAVDAANYGRAPKTGRTRDAAGVTLFTVTCKGSALTGIIRSELPLPDGALGMIEDDTQEILNRWI